MPKSWLLVSSCLFLFACHRSSATPDWELENPLRPLSPPPIGTRPELAHAGVTLTPAKVRLGRFLFFDPRLSADKTISCASCHRPEHAFSDVRKRSPGVGGRLGQRKSPPVVNPSGQHRFDTVYFWDGRAATLAEQARQPITNADEMGNTAEGVSAGLSAIAGYRRLFAEAYGDEHVDLERIGDALAAFELTRLSGASALDRYRAGDRAALSAEARRGLELFDGRAGCRSCHMDWNFTDSQFHNLGIGWNGDAFDDRGRAVVTGEANDTGAFKTPSLRDVARHAPYMHDGSLPTLEAVIDLYDRGGIDNPWLDSRLEPLGLSAADKQALVALLRALDGGGEIDPGPRSFPR